MTALEPTTLRVLLSDWCDWDLAAWALGRALGLFGPEHGHNIVKVKHVFWTNNALGDQLQDTLHALSLVGMLERRDEPDIQYRWNPAYRGTWEGDP